MYGTDASGRNAPGTRPLDQLRILALPLIVFPALLAVPLWFITPDPEPAPAVAVAAGPLLALLGFLLAQWFGYPPRIGYRDTFRRVHTVTSSTPPAERAAFSLAMFRGLMFRVLALAWHVWPSERVIDRCVRQWEQDGRPCYLREALAGSEPGRLPGR